MQHFRNDFERSLRGVFGYFIVYLFVCPFSLQGTSRKALMEMVSSVRNLHSETSLFLAAKAYTTRLGDDILNRLNSAVSATDVELRKVMLIDGALGFPEEDLHVSHNCFFFGGGGGGMLQGF